MQPLCHRCGEALSLRDQSSDATAFCPHCGAPQLSFEADDAPAQEDAPAAAPPPRPRPVDWRAAIGSAALVAAVGALLCAAGARVPVFSLFTCIWVTSASLIALGLYRRRRPQARMDAAIGARIGGVVGLAMAVALAAAMAIIGLIARYPLHAMAGFDAQMAAALHDTMQRAAANGANTTPPELLRVFYSPEFKAAMLLSTLAFVSGGLVLYSTIAGALGGLMYARRSTAL